MVKNERTMLTGGANYSLRQAGQFIFSKIDLLNGAFGIVPDALDGFSSSSDVPAFSFSGKFSPSFFLRWLKANYERLEIERTGTSSTLKRVSPERFLALEVPTPSPAEQQKIADCLISLEEVIAAQGRKVEVLKAYKKGLMQQLFPREGETVPCLRFPEFCNAPEWAERNAGSLFVNRIVKGKDGFPIYSVTMHDGMVRRDSFDRNFYDIDDSSGNKLVRKDDIAYNMMRMWQGALGVAEQDCS
ncbi:MAG: restriction endonuclease subunit S [Nevskia sp.]|nr:restriction endonuclease subunit S [Nevskia sp.]